jgi:hypothetical protein
MTSRSRSARLALCSVLLAAIAALSGTSAAFADTSSPTAWASSGVPTNTVTSDGTTGSDPSFSYDADIRSCGYCERSWTFATTATTAMRVPLNWHYSGLHSWYQATARIQAFVDHNGTRTAVTLQSGGVSGGFDWSGSYGVTVAAGDTYGFIVSGRHYDSSNILRGTLTVQMPTPPVVAIDNVTPAISDATIEANQLGGASVSYTSSATDAQDTTAPATTCTDETASPITSPATFALGGPHSIVCSATDSSGLTGEVQVDFRVVDTTPPALVVPADVTVSATSAAGASVSLPAATATDIVDGSVTPSCGVPADTPTVFGLGTTAVTCTATDAAGNTSAPQSFNVTVSYPWTGFLQPVNTDGTSVFKAGSTVPVKFAVSGSAGPITDATATLSFTKLTSNVEGSYLEATSTAAATTGSLFRYDGSQYIFNWSSKGLTAGTYRVKADLGDGLAHTVQISLK